MPHVIVWLCILTLLIYGQSSYVYKLQVITVVNPPFVERNSYGEIYSGLVIDLLDRIAELMGFTYDIVERDNLEYGTKQLDGSFNGAIGRLAGGSYDLLVTDLTASKARQEAVDFSTPFFCTKVRILRSKDYADDANTVYLVVNGSANLEFITTATTGRLAEIGTHMTVVPSFDDGLRRVLNDPQTVLIGDEVRLLSLLKRDQLLVELDDEVLKTNFYVWATQIDSPLRQPLSAVLLYLTENGELEHLWNTYGLQLRPRDTEEDKDGVANGTAHHKYSYRRDSRGSLESQDRHDEYSDERYDHMLSWLQRVREPRSSGIFARDLTSTGFNSIKP